MAALFDIVQDPRGCNMQIGQKVELSPFNDGGVIKELIQHGDENQEYANHGDTIIFEYFAYNGTEMLEEKLFDSSQRDGEPFDYECLKGRVIRGFEMGILTMRPGERAIIYMTPEYGFGKGGSPPRVPPDTPVIFDTQVTEFRCPDLSMEQDRSITKKTTSKGTGFVYPNWGSLLTMHVHGKVLPNGPVFRDRDVVCELGEGTSTLFDVPKVVEEHLDYWKQKETARLEVKARHAYGEQGSVHLGIPPNSDIAVTVEMKNFVRVKEFWDMNNEEKLVRGEHYKDKGNEYFQRDELILAQTFYEALAEFIEHEMCMIDDQEARRLQLLFTGFLNNAQVKIRFEEWVEAKKCCDKALAIKPDDPKSKKAYFRRGVAYFNMQNFQDARKDFKTFLRKEPKNKEGIKYMRLCNDNMQNANRVTHSLERKMAAGFVKESKQRNED